MINLGLKIAAILIGLLIVVLLILKRSGVAVGIRTTQNIFTEQIANISAYVWLLCILLLIELVILVFLSLSSKYP